MKAKVFYALFETRFYDLVVRYRSEEQLTEILKSQIYRNYFIFTSKQKLVTELKSRGTDTFEFTDYQAILNNIETRLFRSIEDFENDTLPALKSDYLYEYTIKVLCNGTQYALENTIASTDAEALKNVRVHIEGKNTSPQYIYEVASRFKLEVNKRTKNRTKSDDIQVNSKGWTAAEVIEEIEKQENHDDTKEVLEYAMSINDAQKDHMIADYVSEHYGQDFLNFLERLAKQKEISLLELAMKSLVEITKNAYKSTLENELQNKLKAVGL